MDIFVRLNLLHDLLSISSDFFVLNILFVGLLKTTLESGHCVESSECTASGDLYYLHLAV
jgi:hypothetical protein